MNDIIRRYFERKARNSNRPFIQILNFAYQNNKITNDEALLFCSNNWKKMHGFKMRHTEKINCRGEGKRYRKFLWDDKASLVINGKVLSVMKDYVEKERNGIGLREKDIGSKKWDWAFWSDLLNVMEEGHI